MLAPPWCSRTARTIVFPVNTKVKAGARLSLSASAWLDLGAPPHVVREIVGHSAIEVTMTTYAHVLLDEKRKALAKLGDALG
jgi:integrase